MESRSCEIVCAACKADTLVRAEPVFEGFRKVGQRFVCVSCGHAYADEAQIPWKEKGKASVFTDADRSETVSVFREDEKGRSCRHCAHYVVNPFTQWCSVHRKEVQATEFCDRFAPKALRAAPGPG
jgi:hypothetical protein